MARKPRESRKPKRPYPRFPLTPHARGWVKKIRGRTHWFGPPDDPEGALERYHREAQKLHAGTPVPPAAMPERMTLRELGNRFLADKLSDARAGKIEIRVYTAYRRYVKGFLKSAGESTPVSDVGPADFAAYLAALKGKPTSRAQAVQYVRTWFRHAAESEWCPPVNFGRRFRKPSALEVRRAKTVKLWTPEQVRAILAAARGHWRAGILLAVNGGMGASDLSGLTVGAVDLKHALVNYPRAKTGVPRLIPLWPETVEALRPWVEGRAAGDYVFTTRYGNRLVRVKEGEAPEGGVGTMGYCDAAYAAMVRIMGRANRGRKKEDVIPDFGFYSFRRFFRTIADEQGDQRAIDHIMGHIPKAGDMAAVYVQHVAVERLRAVVAHVRERLLLKPGP